MPNEMTKEQRVLLKKWMIANKALRKALDSKNYERYKLWHARWKSYHHALIAIQENRKDDEYYRQIQDGYRQRYEKHVRQSGGTESGGNIK